VLFRSAFTIVAPIWQRWWFRTAVVLALAAAALALHRLRLREVLAVERVRRQVALDLHDDVGSGLTQMAMFAELARRDGAPQELFTDAAVLARSLREAMSDIVWAIDPRKDHLVDVVDRMRDVGTKRLEAHGVRLDFHAPSERTLRGIDLPPDRRRHLVLLFKEAVNNVVKHANASSVVVDLMLAPKRLRLTIADNGAGFDADARHTGHGLASIRSRVEAMHGTLRIESRAGGGGTTIDADIPLR